MEFAQILRISYTQREILEKAGFDKTNKAIVIAWTMSISEEDLFKYFIITVQSNMTVFTAVK